LKVTIVVVVVVVVAAVSEKDMNIVVL